MLKRLIVCALLGAATIASAQPRRPPPPPAAPAFDATGWTLLGTQEVNGRRDRDVIPVGHQEGRFDKITLVVTGSDLVLQDLTVYFANGEKWSPGGLRHMFREGQRSRAVDLPGNNRVIQKIELAYANTPGGGKAKLSIYAKNTRDGRPGLPPNGNPGPLPPNMPPRPVFDSTGWTLLGTQTVQGRRDRDSIRVGVRKGGFDQLTMVVTDSDLDLQDMTIVFTNGQTWSPKVRQVFREGSRTRVIDLPGKDRTISRIDLRYANLPGGGRAKVEIYARDVGRPSPPPFTPVKWENKGWTLLGKKTVDGWRDRDRLNVSLAKPFSALTFVVTGSDVQINHILVTFGNGEKFEMSSPIVFKEGTRTAPVDMPGKLRRIKSIEFSYANLPGGGRASVEVWGIARAQAQPPAPPPPPPPPPAPPAGPHVRDHR